MEFNMEFGMEPSLVVATVPMTHPDASALVREMTLEVAALYDEDPDAPGSDRPELFSPPGGGFLVGYLDGRAVACAGFRRVDGDLGQVNRVFVRRPARGRGLARRMMGHLEALAVEAGYRTLRLETGTLQPSAIRTYEGLGYTPIPAFAPYESDPRSRCYAKRIG